MNIQLLLEVEAPDVALHAADVLADLRQLLVDSLELTLQGNPNCHLRTEIKQIKQSTNDSAILLT
jgi:hypothetical protein